MHYFTILLSLGAALLGLSPAFADTPLHVLFIGDSHSVGTFGKTMDTVLSSLGAEQGGARVETYASCGSSPDWWFSGHETPCGYFSDVDGKKTETAKHATPLLRELITHQDPDLIIIELGANLMGDSLDHAQTTTREMLTLVSEQLAKKPGRRCFWIGPPNGRNKTEPKFSQLYDLIKTETIGICELFDSRLVTHYPATGGDGAHYDSLGPAGRLIAKAWAQSAFDQIKNANP